MTRWLNPLRRIHFGSEQRSFRLGLSGLAVLLASGCQLVSGRTPNTGFDAAEDRSTASVPEGSFEGFIEIEGGRVEGTLTLTPSGPLSFEGLFDSSPDLLARGPGRLRDQWVRLELVYSGSCPGQMKLDGRWEEAEGSLTGSVEASDCTGVAKGTFLFRRR